MKKIFALVITIGLFIGIAAVLSAQRQNENSANPPESVPKPDFPENILKIVERSCFDCHSDNSGNFAAKGKLNYSSWNEYSTARKISRLDAICNMITKGKMPKKSFVKKHPEKALTLEEKEIICKWASEETNKLLGE